MTSILVTPDGKTVEAGFMTKDLALLIGPDQGWMTTVQFLDKLDEVNRLQTEAGKSVEKLVTGESQNMAEVFSAVRKADVAFSLLMEIRNKLMDAYEQIKQMRV